ncbi:hypothetical protein, partial [Carnobacterium sp.]|uniref:hypothetical protein n=1 Tax=Carnobacterium sp. TaxID=48221 RepID=UPI002FCAFA19
LTFLNFYSLFSVPLISLLYKKFFEPFNSGKKIGKIDMALFAISNFHLFPKDWLIRTSLVKSLLSRLGLPKSHEN